MEQCSEFFYCHVTWSLRVGVGDVIGEVCIGVFTYVFDVGYDIPVCGFRRYPSAGRCVVVCRIVGRRRGFSRVMLLVKVQLSL